jgi:hypothetical protein
MSTLSRRDFLATSLAAGGALAASGALRAVAAQTNPPAAQNAAGPAGAIPGTGPAGARRPNILWIQTDEQRPDSLGCYGSAGRRLPCGPARGAGGDFPRMPRAKPRLRLLPHGDADGSLSQELGISKIPPPSRTAFWTRS